MASELQQDATLTDCRIIGKNRQQLIALDRPPTFFLMLTARTKMKTTDKRARTDTAKAAIRATQNAAKPPIEPPACINLRPADRPFWDRIVSSKARDNWTEIDLVTASHLARAQADIEMLQQQIDSDGYVIDGKVNPAAQMLETLSKRAIALTRVLQVHALATVGRSADTVNAAKLEREAAQFDDDLIPTLRAVE